MSPAGCRRGAGVRSLLLVGFVLAAGAATAGTSTANPPAASRLDSASAYESAARAASPPAQDADPVLVTLAELSPPAPTPTDVLTLAGTVTNRSDETLTNLNTYLRLSRIPTTDRDELAAMTAPGFRAGFRPGPFTPLDETLRPGQTLPFRLEVPVVELGLSAPGAYPIGVEILAGFEDGSRGVAGLVMTLLPWLPAGDGDTGGQPAVSVALAVPLTAAVDRGADGTYASDGLGALLAPAGALGELLERGDGALTGSDDDLATAHPLGPAVTWLLDPALLEAAADLADGYSVQGADGSAAPGAYAGAAAAWLDQLEPYVRAGSVQLLSYGHVDAVALVRAGLGADVVAALQAGPGAAAAALEVPIEDLVADPDSAGPLYPPDGYVDQTTLELLASAGVRSLLLADDGLDAERARASVALDVGGELDGAQLHAVRVDAGLAALLAAPQGSLTARQLALSHTLLAALDQQGASTSSPLVVVPPGPLPPAGLPALEVLAGAAPWVEPVPVPRGQSSGSAAGAVRYPDMAVSSELRPQYLAQVAALGTTIQTFASLSGDLAARVELDRARLRAMSAGWRAEPDRATALVDSEVAKLEAELGQVRIVTTGAVTLSSDSGRFPLTVANDLDQPVTVRLALTSRTPARLHTVAPQLVEIAPGAKTTVEVSAQATANGVYIVDARLQTADGAAFGAPVAVTVRATQYDTVAWLVMAAAGGLIFVGSGLRLLRRVRPARQALR